MTDPDSTKAPSNQFPNPLEQATNPTFPPDWNYEVTVTEVEAIINRIELGELELSEVFEQFAIAVEQLRQCETFLTRQQQQVDLLIETLLDEPEAF
ncbi:exodeoxyribonuclease VII small subunit [Leptolyngbya sp. 7M]|uniref:exodeoxyribonuclease VII small subunit n=1 Tax=Leptolyngbya sp. 7M TaxID=2812896 RepID=UPI001B8B861D|nr:exodeoxyribonuclease VII small subunit [Leptolyngbya sp. 7M]QYO64006.1 exodeoxyribonuclease VII small subunit [Leptolyngbya sp. 7M]